MPGRGLLITNVQGVTVARLQIASLLEEQAIDEVAKGLYELVDAKACRKLVVDFSSVSHMASRMLGALVSLNKKARQINGKVILCGIRPNLMKVFKITSLDKILDFAADETGAMRQFTWK